ncbi:MAG: hypothetical protein K0R33_4773, partial [Mycobacterium sp.]|nr:hypothetical protein [Mycobacterium sp.]
EAAQLMAPGPPEGTEAVQQDHQRTVGLFAVGNSVHDMETDAVGMDLQVSPRSVNAYNRRIRPGCHAAVGYQPDGSVVSAGRCASGLSWPGVSASFVSRTDSMVCCGPRIRRTLR